MPKTNSSRLFWYQAGEIYNSIHEVSQEMSYDPITRHEAELLASNTKSFKFLRNSYLVQYTKQSSHYQLRATEKKGSSHITCSGDLVKYSRISEKNVAQKMVFVARFGRC
jgi:hypothetical protein